MINNPETEETLYANLRDRVSNKVEKLTNFTERSFNAVFLSAVSKHFRELEVRLLASQLSGYIEYAGGPITQGDLNKLGVENITPDEINEYMYDEQLDRLVDVVGISRNNGDRATGFIDIETQVGSNVLIPEGTVVTTTPDEQGETLSFETIEEENSGSTQSLVPDVEVQSIERGSEYNIPANSITRFQDPPVGVRGISDSTGMSGGEGRETNESLRQRSRNAVSEQPTGGTANGIVGYISNNIEPVDPENIGITEIYEENTVEVTVDGGGEQSVKDAIDEGKPVGVRHNLIRPQTIELSVTGKLLGSDINITFVDEEVESYLLNELNVGDNFYTDNLIQIIVESTSNILNVSQLRTKIQAVTNERKEYDETVDKYRLDYTHNGVESEVIDQFDNSYSEADGDYTIIDDSGDGKKDTLRWDAGPSNDLTTGDDFFIEYSSSQSTDLIADEVQTFNKNQLDLYAKQTDKDEYVLSFVPEESTVQIEDPDTGNYPYMKNTDYTIENVNGDSSKTEFVFSSGETQYTLNESVFSSSVTITDESGKEYINDDFNSDGDYKLLDRDEDGIKETVEWDTGSGTSPTDGQVWTAQYTLNNGIPQTIVWQNNTEPNAGEEFVVQYDQKVYKLDKEVNVINDEVIKCSCPSSSFDYETDFNFVDKNGNGKKDSINWITGGSTPSDNEVYYVTYKSNGDIVINNQQKIDAGNVQLTPK